MKFCGTVDIHDLITYVNFGDDRLRGLWVALGVNFWLFPLTLIVVLTTLPCECVIIIQHIPF